MIKQNKKRTRTSAHGIALITTLFLLVFIVMFAASATIATLRQQRSCAYCFWNAAALKMAETGVSYAMARLNQDPSWQGCTTEPEFHLASGTGVEVYEHQVTPDCGCVEGKVTIGDQAGYFDLYFIRQGNPENMRFISSVPSEITLSSNNSAFRGGTNPVHVFNSLGTEMEGKWVPRDSVLIVCRGMFGSVVKTAEVCFTIGPDSGKFDSVIIGGGNVKLIHAGTDEATEKIVLREGASGEGAIVRSVGTMTLGLSDERQEYGSNKDYLDVQGTKSGGFCGTGDPIFSPTPFKGYDTFDPQSGQDGFLPKLKKDDVMPDTTGFVGIPAGTYSISPKMDPSGHENAEKYPDVFYYPTNTAPNTCITQGRKDESETFKRYIDEGKMTWDPVSGKLTILQSFKVDPVTGAGAQVTDLNFIPLRGAQPTEGISCDNRLIVQVGPDPVAPKPGDPTPVDNERKPVYLVNNCSETAAIRIDGQLSGTATVLCGGDLEMEAESQLSANESNGISIFSGGNTTVNPIQINPYIDPDEGTTAAEVTAINEYNLRQSIIKKIHQFTIEKKSDPEFCSISRPVDRPAGASSPHIDAYMQEASDLGLRDAYRIPLCTCFFTEEEHDYIVKNFNTLPGQYTNGSHENTEHLIFDMSPELEGDPSFGTPFNTLVDNELGGGQTVTIYRIWYMDEFLSGTGGVETKTDSKGRIIKPKDSIFRGLIYSSKDFTVNSPKNAIILEGGLVSQEGNISITSSDSSYRYDSRYLNMLTGTGETGVTIHYWSAE